MGNPIDIASKVFDLFAGLDSKQKCLIEVTNSSGETLRRMSENHDSGGFATLPEDEIPPGGKDVFIAHDTGFLRGAVGDLTYGVFPAGAQVPQGTWKIHWSIPEKGDPSSSAVLEGGLAERGFGSRDRIGAGDETEAKFELLGPGGGKKAGPGGAGPDLKSTVLIEIRNHTDVPLTLLDQGHDHGGFVTQPAPEIPPGGTDSFASFETDRSGTPGSKGFLKYQVGANCEWTVGWDNPENADNTSESTLDGADAGAFSALDQIGAGEENVPAVYTISRRSGGGGGKGGGGEDTENEVAVLIANQTSRTLALLDSGSFSGRFRGEVAQQIAPGESATFVSGETEDRTTGAAGFVRFLVGDPGESPPLWTMIWDNPEHGENTVSSTLEGDGAAGFDVAGEIGPERPRTSAVFTVVETAEPRVEPVFAPPVEADEPTLRMPDQSVDGWVEYLQMLLNTEGFGPLPVDGDFNQAVDTAVRAFQTQRRDQAGGRLMVDGVVGNQTWAALRQEAPREPSTDGRTPHTYVEQGAEMRFFTEDDSVDYFAEQDLITLTAANTGDVQIEPFQFEATARITFPSGEQHTFTVPFSNNNVPAAPGEMCFFIGPVATAIGQQLDPGTYFLEAYLPAELGGDETARDFTIP